MKLKLNMDEMAEDFFEDTRLLGIVAPVKSYQFCWQLNHLFRLNFRVNPDVEIPLTRKGRLYYFAVFEYREQNSALCHYLYNNQNDGEYLLPEFKHLDFLWLMKGDVVNDTTLHNVINSIKAINAVQLVTELTNEKIKNKGHLIF
ncbi:IPExxxVDY family protein [Pinibacter soli]|uniref:IPExxxVDY family protein n=1 Tax=Pinibacter soli TaxID=3044211 RepID=A0ABT6R8U6_9BACT|nr:IPExxxVDY family protein [Pinibacter soli]MDI3318987.1 IPExxxVDY family protein [Pinibacter soli]